MATHRIILKKKKGLIGAEYIDVEASCAVVPDQLAKLTREKRKERADDGYSEAYFDKDLNIVFVKVKAGTKGSITLTLTAAYHFNEWGYTLAPRRRNTSYCEGASGHILVILKGNLPSELENRSWKVPSIISTWS